jgi:PHD/YefM family antitoxin component YafN of YafNO toxin-antitoxin module
MCSPIEPGPPLLTVTAGRAFADFKQLIDTMTSHGAHMAITRDETPEAVLVSWGPFREARERLARAYCPASSSSGPFDDEGFGHEVAVLEHPQSATLPNTNDQGQPDA